MDSMPDRVHIVATLAIIMLMSSRCSCVSGYKVFLVSFTEILTYALFKLSKFHRNDLVSPFNAVGKEV